MWTKNFENLINGTAFVNDAWSQNGSSINVETPYSIVDINGEIQNIVFRNSYSSSSDQSSYLSFFTTLNPTTFLPTTKDFIIKDISQTPGTPKSFYVYFGSGTAPESRDDYTITPITEIVGVGNTMQNLVTKNEENNSYDLTISSAIQCPNACTINEICIYKSAQKYATAASVSSDTNGRYSCKYILYRKVLDTPIVLQPNEPATVTFQISLPRITLA